MMTMHTTPEEKEIGKGNFNRVVGKLAAADQPNPQAPPAGVTRRRFMQGLVAVGATVPVSAAAYFGYSNHSFPNEFRPVKAGLIGAGDEGGVLVGEHDPNYVNFVAYSDIRPSNQNRIFVGQPNSPRRGFNAFREHYGSNPREHIRLYENYHELLDNPDIEMVVIALPLHLHAEVAIEAMEKGKHVLCEKLMGWNITQCKRMIRTADRTGKLLAIGHQRHYSMLYAHANEVVQEGVLGDIKHIRALWHRNNVRPNPDMQTNRERPYLDSWWPVIPPQDRQHLEANIRSRYGYKDLNELVRWRIYTRTGGGLMAELGSHQLDACSIFLGKKKPLAVTASGGKHFYQDNREAEDHVYCIYEFPGANYDPNVAPRNAAGANQYNDVVTVTYSSISTNGFEPYGECVMGSKGTLIIEMEQNALLYGIDGRLTQVTAGTAGGRATLLDASSTAPPAQQATAPAEARAATTGQSAVASPPSRGYREEMNHLAYCIRSLGQNPSDEERRQFKPRCDGRAAMADAIIALTANQAMKRRQRIEFDPRWFDASSDEVPDRDMIEERIS